MPDAKLVARLRAGDEAAFEAIFDRYHRQLLAFCRHMLGTREEAEDALQHAFVSAHRHLVTGEDRVVELRPWLYAIARNRCLSVLRARREAVALDDVPEPSGDGLAVGDEVERRQDLQEVLGDLARLPDDQRAALVLSELGDLSHDEVADVLGVRRDKVKALVFQARESLAGWREARNTDCREIREQLATLRGGALRRGPLRKHLDTCDGCRAFRDDVRRQREAMALLLPVVPSVALKAKVLGAVAAGGHLAPVAGGVGAGVGSGLAGTSGAATAGTAAGGSFSALAGGMAGKALIVAAIAGTAGGGYAVVKERSASPAPEPAVRMVTPQQARGAAAPTPTAAPTPVSATPAAAGGGAGTAAAAHRRAAARKAAKAVPGAASVTSGAHHGRPAVPGANGLAHAPKAQGLQHRPATPPGRSAGGTHGASSSKSASSQSGSRPAHPVRPSRPAKPTPARPAAPSPPRKGGQTGASQGNGASSGRPASSGSATDVVDGALAPKAHATPPVDAKPVVGAVGNAAKP